MPSRVRIPLLFDPLGLVLVISISHAIFLCRPWAIFLVIISPRTFIRRIVVIVRSLAAPHRTSSLSTLIVICQSLRYSSPCHCSR
ncbi:hypothetical protein EDB19DRAFT_1791691 [Suillus lakei]|nr:hypothetical protein EDB19DRAFT_1791691 [Suillus lakei]